MCGFTAKPTNAKELIKVRYSEGLRACSMAPKNQNFTRSTRGALHDNEEGSRWPSGEVSTSGPKVTEDPEYMGPVARSGSKPSHWCRCEVW
ncbi:hypothetical protein AVEN_193116-1 [Araneus ventricosus]|uniref:Uncharacterized protein n=1 Tax=Araneus ventricosus TaxID=182803 RepID=A0A4Y2B2U2_ARAVE|nr:hypothetical protein AVEN_193116-1 [Araneus ventricosus]